MKPLGRIAAMCAALLVCAAHIGSPDAWFAGAAGPYPVRVHVEAPTVIPGIATVNVYVLDTASVSVSATANRFDATGGAPPPEIARLEDPVARWYRTRLWIMTSGSYSITVNVSGKQGSGAAVIPLAAVPLRKLAFSPALGVGLGLVGVMLFAGVITIIGAGVRESALAPGVQPDAQRERKSRIAMGVAAVAVALVLYGTSAWWRAEDAAFERTMFRPMTSVAAISDGELSLSISDSSWIMRHNEGWLRSRSAIRRTPLMLDHGKVMHLFLFDATGGNAMAHLHPGTTDSVTFTAALPPLPPGRYSVFGDIVHSDGFAETLVANVDIREGLDGGKFSGGDDAYAVRAFAPRTLTVPLADGSYITWAREPSASIAGEDAGLRFRIVSPSDAPPLEDYMGMPAHAAVIRDDAGVFIHLHPVGTISVAAQQKFSAAAPTHGSHVLPEGVVEFPYSFPEAGRYFVWVQVKRAGRVLSGVFEVSVEENRAR